MGAALTRAAEMAGDGFTVWIFEKGRLVQTITPGTPERAIGSGG